MLCGNVIFIKKSGGDGSKFPVVNKSLKIGRSDDCIIRIQNPLVSPEHCQLIVDNNGQVKIKNLSSKNPTTLNDKPLGSGEVVLRQGDVFKIGDRYARWEYLPSSNFYQSSSYQQSGQSSQRMVAVVAPQIRISEEHAGTSSDRLSAASRKMISERVTSAGTRSMDKTQRLSLGFGKVVPNRKMFSRRSLQLKKLAFSPQVKLRRSAVLESLGTPKMGSAKKTPVKPSQTWEVKSVSPVDRKKSVQKLVTNRKSTPIKMPMTRTPSEKMNRSTMKSASTKFSNLLTIAESSPPGVTVQSAEKTASSNAPQSKNLTSTKTPLKTVSTPASTSKRQASPRQSLPKSNKKGRQSKASDPKELPSAVVTDSRRESLKSTPAEKATLRKSVLKKSLVPEKILEESPSAGKGVETPKKVPGTPDKDSKSLKAVVELTRLGNSANRSRAGKEQTPSTSKEPLVESSTPSGANLPQTPAPKRSERLSQRKRKSVLTLLKSPREKVKTPPRDRSASTGRRPGSVGGRMTPKGRDLKRRYSAVASAERAAKKLKTIAPTKPDKNKKAALLVLGKATGKLKPLPSAKVVIKQKIVKRAIKQTTKARKASGTLKSRRKVSLNRKALLQKKALLAKRKSLGGGAGGSKKPSDSSEESSASSSSKRRSAETTPPKEPSSPKKAAAETPSKTKAETPAKRSDKSATPTPAASQTPGPAAASGDASVPSKASGNKSLVVSLDRVNSPLQYLSPDALYNAVRRASKRLSSQNFTSRPDFTELTPTALGLAPKEIVDGFKTPKQVHRRSSSLVTPKNKGTSGIIKSASTSKINRKSVRFSSKDLNDSSFSYSTQSGNTTFDFNRVDTPEITIDLFVSPITPKSNLKTPSSVARSLRMEAEPNVPESSVESQKDEGKGAGSTRLSRSPRAEVEAKIETRSGGKSPGATEDEPAAKKIPKPAKSPKNDLTDVKGVRRLLATPKPAKSPLNDLREVRGVRRLMATPKPQKSPLNDLTDVRGVKRLMASPRTQKSPLNDLTDVRGVRRLMESLRNLKSPKNDLMDVRGVKQLMASPKQQKSPLNDLTDVKGVKRLMTLPKKQKSPLNDLTDVRGVRQLMESPRPRKSPRNDLTDVKGVKRLMESPKPQKSPRNDLTDVRGVRRLMESPRPRKSPRNDLTDVTGVKQLLIMKSPRNDLSNVSGTDALFKTPSDKIQCLRTLYNPVSKSPKNDLSDVSGVRQLFSMNKENNSLDVSLTGVAELFKSPQKAVSPKKRARDAEEVESAEVKVTRLSEEEEEEKPTLRGASRIAVRDTRKGRAKAALPSPPEETSPKMARVTRSTRKVRAEKSPTETTRAKTRAEREAKDSAEEATGRGRRGASKIAVPKRAVKRQVEESKSATPVKRTRKAAAVGAEEKTEAPAKAAGEAKEKKVVVEAASPESKPSQIKTRRKSIARQSPKVVKKSTRAKASEATQKAPRVMRAKAKPVKETSVSPVKTRRKVKESSSSTNEKDKTKSSPVKTRSRAK